MFRNYLVTALRNFARHKLYSVINIAGLTVALTCAIFIMLFLANELSYDRFIPHTNDVYRVEFSYNFPGQGTQRDGNSMFVLGPAVKAQIPQVLAYTHIAPAKVTLKAGGRLFSQSIDAVDPDFFRVIGLPLVAGDPMQALRQPGSMVLSEPSRTNYSAARIRSERPSALAARIR